MASANPTLRQRQLATRLRELRHGSGLSIAEVAGALLCSPAKISRIETAQRRVSLRDVRDLCRLYRVENSSELMALAKDAREQGWWQDGEDVDFRPVPGLENDAIRISEYETTTIPGLLQTEEYAQAVIHGSLPQIDPIVLQERVAYRMKRQDVLRKKQPPRYWVLLDESALHRHIGGLQVMAEQLEKVVHMAGEPHITVQVVPFKVGAHMALDSAFMLLEFDPSAGVADTVYMDTLAGQIFQEKPAQLARFREVLNQLRAVALSPRDSIALIRERIAAFQAES
ncbi:helix-turn-helix domain-containing protein [Nonomuraea sp. NPDC048826]|uniref:helix-turn-helix domain-containing protein n=1 Tax=Nonomuraea sp. NPDC048826 TaxID=3364347 RepID=UPI0037192FCE